MQFVLNKLGFTHYSFSSTAAKADAYSPFATHINDIENKRSKLFPDRRRIPGRKTKYIVAIAYLIHAFTIMKLCHAKRVHKQKVEQQINTHRKSLPYFQSITDVEYTIQKHRMDLMVKEALGEQFLKTPIFHKNLTFLQNREKDAVWVGYGLGRYAQSTPDMIKGSYLPGFNIQNI